MATRFYRSWVTVFMSIATVAATFGNEHVHIRIHLPIQEKHHEEHGPPGGDHIEITSPGIGGDHGSAFGGNGEGSDHGGSSIGTHDFHKGHITGSTGFNGYSNNGDHYASSGGFSGSDFGQSGGIADSYGPPSQSHIIPSQSYGSPSVSNNGPPRGNYALSSANSGVQPSSYGSSSDNSEHGLQSNSILFDSGSSDHGTRFGSSSEDYKDHSFSTREHGGYPSGHGSLSFNSRNSYSGDSAQGGGYNEFSGYHKK